MESSPAKVVPIRPWRYAIAASAYGAPDSPMREWWQNRFILPILTTSSEASARHRIGQVEGSTTLRSSGPFPPVPRAVRDRSRTPKGVRHRDAAASAAGKAAAKDAAKGELCGLFNKGTGKCAGRATCVYGRKHLCEKCKGAHPAIECRSGGKAKGKGKDKDRRR